MEDVSFWTASAVNLIALPVVNGKWAELARPGDSCLAAFLPGLYLSRALLSEISPLSASL